MTGPRTQRKPTFLWQAGLIVLPVAVLAVMGWMAVRQDRILAEHDATERAKAIADDLAARIWNELSAAKPDPLSQRAFQADATGQLVFPPPYTPLPTPQPFNLAELNAEQARLWAALQNAAADVDKTNILDESFKTFIASTPPENFAAAATYERGLRLVQQNRLAEAVEAFGLVAENYTNATGESGLPLWPLAQFYLLEYGVHEPRNLFGLPRVRFTLGPVTSRNSLVAPDFPALVVKHFVSLDSFCSNIIYRPTPLTPYFLNTLRERADEDEATVRIAHIDGGTQSYREAQRRLRPLDSSLGSTSGVEVAVLKWQQVWQDHDLSRQLFSAARPTLPVPAAAPFWFTTPEAWSHPAPILSGMEIADRTWLAIPVEAQASNRWFLCRAESEVGAKVSDLANNTTQIPEYYGIEVKVAGKTPAFHAPDLRVWYYRQLGGGKGAGGFAKELTEERSRVLATAAKLEQGAELVKVTVYLTSPTTLFQRQRSRAFWFGALILVSTAAALAGLMAAWRAFRRQLQLSDMKSNFVSSVSHELRAPIASVRLLAESLERGKIAGPEKQHEYFGFIVQECRRLSSLIENVLDFSRIEQGRKQYEFEPTNLAALVNQTVTLMQPYAAEKGVNLEVKTFNIQHSTPNVEGETATHLAPDTSHLAPSRNLQPGTPHLELNIDGKAIQQALVNLIDNAIKHSPKGETVCVQMKSRSWEVISDQSSVISPSAEGAPDSTRDAQDAAPFILHPSSFTLSVKDNGPGIPPEEHGKIFERFYRRGSELRRETQGVGIGLSIVKHIVEAHGGRVLVESAPGKGSRFTIQLPLQL